MDVAEIIKRVNAELDAKLTADGLAAQAKAAQAVDTAKPNPPASGTVSSAVSAASAAPTAIPAELLAKIDVRSVPSHIEHSVLNPDMSREKIVAECKLAKEFKLANICVTPYFVSEAASVLRDSGVAVCAPVGFPHAAASSAAKYAEIRECLKNGATELDVELNIVAIKSGEFDKARHELQEMLDIAARRCVFKAIYEQALFTDDEKKAVLAMIREAKCDYVKISNALTGKAALEDDVRFVRGIVGDAVKIKIDGGIRTLQRALEILACGADRMGMSASVKVAQEALKG